MLESVGRVGVELFDMPVLVDASWSGNSPVSLTGFFDESVLRYRHEHLLATPDGEIRGKLKLVDFQSHPPLEPKKQAALRDLGIVTTGYLQAREAIGQIDHVTLLPNRLRFLRDAERLRSPEADRVSQTLVVVTFAEARAYGSMLRALGHAFADSFIRLATARARAVLPHELVVYHVSVLSLAFLLPESVSPETTASRIVAAFAKPVECDGVPISTAVGVGIVELGPGCSDQAEMLRAAFTAAQDSRTSPTGWSRYDKKSDAAHKRAFALLGDLEGALASPDQLSLHFQPRVNLATGRCVGAEALLRWHHPTLGPISPAEFMPLVETTAHITPLTDWVLRNGVQQAKRWAKSSPHFKLAMNVSPDNLREEDFAGRLADHLEESGVSPTSIELEFTERALAAGEAQVSSTIGSIRDLGVDIAIDDFGTGYSNMSYLTDLPAQIVKIDQSFVRGMADQPRRQMLVQAINNMAHALGFRVVAEGIETKDAYRMLRDWGCDEGQGYLMSRPLPADQFATWFERTRSL